ncbi:hypothetical protein NDU88_004729 [Pleurodeles waltl]|uniref:Uncharacterized protein n=1 Tax=Pleurodeles waltl TaxID=8319 RepID=A0AAV7MUQ3_PLEWA|nr:hypothetical protein NDU88_004729 [Pleurodeles waltl]
MMLKSTIIQDGAVVGRVSKSSETASGKQDPNCLPHPSETCCWGQGGSLCLWTPSGGLWIPSRGPGGPRPHPPCGGSVNGLGLVKEVTAVGEAQQDREPKRGRAEALIRPERPQEAWDWIEERPRLGRGGSGEPEKTSRTAEGARPKEWSLLVRRGRRRQRTGRSTPWRIPRRADVRADTTDSEGNRSVGAWTRSGQEGTNPQTPENRTGLGRESQHPLLEAIDRMEVEQEARILRVWMGRCKTETERGGETSRSYPKLVKGLHPFELGWFEQFT